MTIGTAVRTISQAERDPSKITTTIRQLSDLVSGQGTLASGGTGADLSATGGAHQVLQQTTVGGHVTVGQLSAADLSNGTTGTAGSNVVLKTSPALTTPDIGAATGTSLAATGAITSNGGGIGYATGAGGTVTQITTVNTAVTLNKLSGEITPLAAVYAALASQGAFTVNNSFVAATDVIACIVKNIATLSKFYNVHVSNVTNGSFDLFIQNAQNSSSSSESPIVRFAVIKAVTT